MREHPLATVLATGFGSGFAPIAPGTAGSFLALAAGWIAVATFSSHMPSVVAGVGLLTSGLVVAALAVGFCIALTVTFCIGAAYLLLGACGNE